MPMVRRGTNAGFRKCAIYLSKRDIRRGRWRWREVEAAGVRGPGTEKTGVGAGRNCHELYSFGMAGRGGRVVVGNLVVVLRLLWHGNNSFYFSGWTVS